METHSNESSLAPVDVNKLGVPGAIVVAGIIIALAVIYTGGKNTAPTVVDANPNDLAGQAQAQQQKLIENVKPVSGADHLIGNPNAPVKMIEFTDIECPFCERIQPTLRQVMDEYGKNGQVAWVIRHFPLSIHPQAMPAALASECVFDQKGEIAFWDYVNALFDANLTNQESDVAIFSSEATKLGVNLKGYNDCVVAQNGKSKISGNISDGLAAGVSGTPYTIVVAKNGKKFPINGAQSYESIKAIIDLAIKEG